MKSDLPFPGKIQSVISAKILAFTLLVYFGLFQKEFDVSFKDSGRVINTDH